MYNVSKPEMRNPQNDCHGELILPPCLKKADLFNGQAFQSGSFHFVLSRLPYPIDLSKQATCQAFATVTQVL